MVSVHWVASAACWLNASLMTGITDVAPPISLQVLLQLWYRSVATCLLRVVTWTLHVLTFNFYHCCERGFNKLSCSLKLTCGPNGHDNLQTLMNYYHWSALWPSFITSVRRYCDPSCLFVCWLVCSLVCSEMLLVVSICSPPVSGSWLSRATDWTI